MVVPWMPNSDPNCDPNTPPLTDYPADPGWPTTAPVILPNPEETVCTPALPTDEPSLVQWSVASDVNLPVGSPVFSWPQRAGVLFTKPATISEPVVGGYSINGRNFIDFTNQTFTALEASTEIIPRTRKTIIIWFLPNGPSFGTLIDQNNTDRFLKGFSLFSVVPDQLIAQQATSFPQLLIYQFLGIGGISTSQPTAVTITWDGTTSGQGVKYYLNRTLIAVTTSTSASVPTPTRPARLGLAQVGTNDPFNGSMGEVIMFNDNLSETKVKAQVCRLFLDWCVEVPQ